jgi:hypothetical protein
LVLLLFAFLLLISGQPPANAQGQRLVLVHYYVWWSADYIGSGNFSDSPAEPYNSWDASAIARHVQQAASADIDGMVVAWYGPSGNNQTETNFRVVQEQASANGIYALLSVDLGRAEFFGSTQEVIDGLNHLLNVHANHPSYLRINGRPVIYFWFQGRYSLSDWQYIRSQVDPDHNSIWMAEGAALDMLPTFDGLYLYTISWAPNVYGTLSSWAGNTRAAGGVWAATAMPGWNNVGNPYAAPEDQYTRDRENGNFYRDTFAAAAATNPDMIVITSWNEWQEGTHIEPSAVYGDYYLTLTRELAGAYHASGAVAGGGASSGPAPSGSAPAAGDDQGAAAPAPAPEPTATPTESPTPAPTPTPTRTPTPTATMTPALITLPSLTPTPAPGEETSINGETYSTSEKVALGIGIGSGVVGLLILAALVVWRLRNRPS